METKSVMIVGVGGQGTLLASRLLGNVLISRGYDVKVSEVHGMSQRGGSVVTYVKYGDRVSSPVVEHGEADIIIAFELLEAARYLPYLKKGGTIVVNTQQIDPMPVVTGAKQYPEALLSKLQGTELNIVDVDALALSLEAGNAKAVNVVLLGVAARFMSFDGSEWVKVIADTVPPKFLEVNQKAFDLGYKT
ncbi:MAG: indolepyruvate oxidoreductase subunit beta [Oscillospiraceae bacterium]|jgi:indolepyruvate ferredoxin oxidoreductase beta subunit|nr:indolepyruvate oxidoreductase subunit beta [Oscillospiraceae bacterium]